MKHILPFLILSSFFLEASDFNIDKIIQKIERVKSTIKRDPNLDYNVYDPFATAKPILKQKAKVIKSVQPKPLRIQTIFNHKVLIDGRWYSVGESVHGAKIKAINNTNIVIIKNYKQKTIYRRNKKKLIQTKEVI